ncbi:MAG TPA: FimV/HubP family polar landmark protein [Steroidobacteraceae bacterium]|jgi:pilus assembly protein FimV|nr:FimV/HubP family polar landmark protein [Steroidobacteraceae bacterium]
MTGTLQRLIALVLLFCPTALFALGLGDIRLNSSLNEPLDAEIELVGAAPDELTSLRATLADQETFTRYGLERSAFLSKIEFKVGQGKDGRPALLVRSRESVADPFLTLLVDVNWSRGRLLREYTMLLDPPVYTPGAEQATNAPVSAPQAGATESARSGAVERAPETHAAPPTSGGVSRAPEPSAASGASMGSSYTVRNNDTLWRIASGVKPGATSDVNRMMLAIYRANPQAFSGNINDLHAGAILRLPNDAEFDSVGATEASAEVRRQYAEWRGNRGVAASGTSSGERLRLVTPTEGGEGSATQAAAGAQTKELQDKVSQLQGQVAEQQRLLELKNKELAELQQKTGKPAEPTPAPVPAPTTETPPPAETPPVETQATAPSETPTEATTAPPAAEPQPTPAEQPKPAPPPVAAEEPSILDWIIAHWYYAAAALLILILLWIAARRRRQEPDFSNLGRLADAARGGGAAAREPRIEREPVTTPVRTTRPVEDTFLVEESGERQQPKIAKAAEPARAERPRPEPVRGKSADDTMSSETAINLDQGDPLAEADFHMAYGLYDQAADLVRIAIEREPKRRDLKLKLLEIFFVWGNKDAFLQAARELKQTSQEAAPGEWDKISIMGRQISPEDPMFTQAPGTAGAAAADVDLNLEGGENRVDLDLLGPAETDTAGGIDLDLGTVSADDSTAETGESLALKDQGLDFPLEDQPVRDSSATTREMAARTMETPTIETETYRGHDVPTVESPALRGRDSPTIKEKIDSALFRKDETGSDQTAELALDDLGLELNELAAAQSDPLEETDHPSNAPTMLAGLDDKSRRLLAEAEARRSRLADDEDTKISPTGTWVLEDKTMAATLALPGAPDRDTSATTSRNRALPGDGAGDTARRRRLDAESTAEMPRGGEMDLDLDRLEAALTSDTIKQPRKAEDASFASDVFGAKDLAATDLDLDVGEVNRDRDREPTSTARIPADEMGLPELEPVTMSEVGTKLDLARAYMDMGDPEGARSILEEVLQEGSATQKQEAQRLIESLPG